MHVQVSSRLAVRGGVRALARVWMAPVHGGTDRSSVKIDPEISSAIRAFGGCLGTRRR